MAMKRRRSFRSKPKRRIKRARRTMKYGRRMTRRMRNVKGGYLRVRRQICGIGQLSFNTTATSGFWRYITPTLDNMFPRFTDGVNLVSLTNISEYIALFDQYKLNAIKFTFRPRYSNINQPQTFTTAGQTTFSVPRVAVVYDNVASVTPTGLFDRTTLNTLEEQGGVRFYRGDRPFSIYLKPKVQEQYGGGATRYVKPKWTDLDTNGRAVTYRGFHMFVYNDFWDSTMLSNTSFDIQATVYLQFKNFK